MDRAYQISVNETTSFNLAAFGLDNPPDRITARYLVLPDRLWRYCSADLLVTTELLDYRAEWDGEEPDNRDEWADALADIPIDRADPGFQASRLIKVDPCAPRWYDKHEASADPASPIEWAPFVLAAAYQGDYSEDSETASYDQAREDASGNHLV